MRQLEESKTLKARFSPMRAEISAKSWTIERGAIVEIEPKFGGECFCTKSQLRSFGFRTDDSKGV